jgi:hypothetical protein
MSNTRGTKLTFPLTGALPVGAPGAFATRLGRELKTHDKRGIKSCALYASD